VKKRNNWKDFLYDKNDIFIAAAILVVAALIIIWRMDVIMAYPQTLAEEAGAQTTSEESVDGENADTDTQTAIAENSASDLWVNGVLSRDITVTIQGGSATAAVESLVDVGLFASYDEFSQVCQAAGYTSDQIKATTFTFTAGMTQTDIAKMVTI
jgi:hypothetical protein